MNLADLRLLLDRAALMRTLSEHHHRYPRIQASLRRLAHHHGTIEAAAVRASRITRQRCSSLWPGVAETTNGKRTTSVDAAQRRVTGGGVRPTRSRGVNRFRAL